MQFRRLGALGFALSLLSSVWACSSPDDTSESPDAGGVTSSMGPSNAGGVQDSGSTPPDAGQASNSSDASVANPMAQDTGVRDTGTTTAGDTGATGRDAESEAGSVDSATPASDAGSGGAFALTSSAYTAGMTIPPVHTCAGANTSPPLAWTPGPAGTKSYTLIFTDQSNMLVHWALWDIPGATTSLPAALAAGMPAGSHGASIGSAGAYAGPCPSGSLHTYQFDLYAVDVETLPIAANSRQAAVVTAVMSHKLGVASLSGTSNARRP